MTLSEELYFEINVDGELPELRKFANYLTSGELDDYFEISADYISYNDDFETVDEGGESGFVFTNDDLGIEISEFDPEDFLEIFCKAGAALEISGHFYDLDDEEFSFVSPKGDDSFTDQTKIDKRFNDELDEVAFEEEKEERD